MKCDRENCENEATVLPILVCKAKLPTGRDWKLDLMLGLQVCDDHADTNVNTYVTNKGWRKIKRGFQTRSLPVPDRKELSIRFQPLKPPEPPKSEGKILTL
jgi:hypothetical protein